MANLVFKSSLLHFFIKKSSDGGPFDGGVDEALPLDIFGVVSEKLMNEFFSHLLENDELCVQVLTTPLFYQKILRWRTF